MASRGPVRARPAVVGSGRSGHWCRHRGDRKTHDEKKIGVDLQESLPANSSAIVAVVDDLYLDRVKAAFEQATKKISKAIAKGDYDADVRAVNEGDVKIVDAINS